MSDVATTSVVIYNLWQYTEVIGNTLFPAPGATCPEAGGDNINIFLMQSESRREPQRASGMTFNKRPLKPTTLQGTWSAPPAAV